MSLIHPVCLAFEDWIASAVPAMPQQESDLVIIHQGDASTFGAYPLVKACKIGAAHVLSC